MKSAQESIAIVISVHCRQIGSSREHEACGRVVGAMLIRDLRCGLLASLANCSSAGALILVQRFRSAHN